MPLVIVSFRLNTALDTLAIKGTSKYAAAIMQKHQVMQKDQLTLEEFAALVQELVTELEARRHEMQNEDREKVLAVDAAASSEVKAHVTLAGHRDRHASVETIDTSDFARPAT